MKVLLVDDHPLFLDGLKNMLASRGIEVVGKARDGFEALEKARSLAPDLILMDINMPRCDGVSATRLIKAERPEIRIVMLTMSADNEDLFAAIRSGACGYLLKTLDTDEFFALFDCLARGDVAFSPGLAGRILQEFARERNQPRPAAGAGAIPAPGRSSHAGQPGTDLQRGGRPPRPHGAHRQVPHERDHGAAAPGEPGRGADLRQGHRAAPKRLVAKISA